MSPAESASRFSNPLAAMGIGLALGLLVVVFALREARFAGQDDVQLKIQINGVEERMARDVLLPNVGWVLEIALPPKLPPETLDTLQVTLRAERTGAMIEVADQLNRRGDIATLVIPESLGLYPGLLSIRATLKDEGGAEIEAYRRVRIRRWLGGPPIGSRELVHFDFGVDRDEDGQPDFESDLARLGLVPSPTAAGSNPRLTRTLAGRIADRALARVERAYDRLDDPNRTGRARDQVYIRFAFEADPGPFVTQICVGGPNLEHPQSIGNVQFDHRNARKSSNECDPQRVLEDGTTVRVAAGIFPSEFSIYEESPLYREVLGPFLTSQGGMPFGLDPRDSQAIALEAATHPSSHPEGAEMSGIRERRAEIDRAIDVFGDALGTVMAHETAHALGLVPEGKPGVGLFGGGTDAGDAYAHNLDFEDRPPSRAWLMNVGREFRFEDLAGRGEAGELGFRPLNYAYLKDRVVLVDGRP